MTSNDTHRQHGFSVCCEWGARGIQALAWCELFVIVDVLSFSTCVDIACARGAEVLPWSSDADGHMDDGGREHARRHRALLAERSRAADALSLSPASLTRIESGTRLVLPSPNGASLSRLAAAHGEVLCACLRNADAVARAVEARAPTAVAVIPAGERWPDHSLRPALEDWLGAGAVIAGLGRRRQGSPEAIAAADGFEASARHAARVLADSASGRELIQRGFAADVALAGELYVSTAVPRLTGEAFSSSSSQ